MAEKHTVAMFIQEDGERKQVGWASPAENGTRTFEFSPGYSGENRPSLKNVSFEDDELTQLAAAEQEAADNETTVESESTEEYSAENVEEDTEPSDSYPQAGDEGKDSPPVQVETNEELAAEPVENVGEETVELSNGGEITEVAGEEEDEEAAFERELAAEQEQLTRRALRENENKENN